MTNQEMASVLESVRDSVERSFNAFAIALASMHSLEGYDPSFFGRLKTHQESLDRQFSEERLREVEKVQTLIDRLKAGS
jgi:hypothetical protein